MLEHLQSWEMMIGFLGKQKVFWGMILVPECVAKDSRFTFWGLGVESVRVTLLLVSETVRARPSWQKSWSMGEANKNVSFSKCQKMWSCSFCVAGAALCDIRCVCVRVRSRREGKVAVSLGEATKTCLSPHVRRYGHVVLRGRHGTL